MSNLQYVKWTKTNQVLKVLPKFRLSVAGLWTGTPEILGITFRNNHLTLNSAPSKWNQSMEIERQTLRAETATDNCDPCAAIF